MGKIITGKEQTDEETRAQINRADKDRDDKLSLEEWLDFSSMLGRLTDPELDVVIGGYIERVKKDSSSRE